MKPTILITDNSVDTGHLLRTTLQTHNFYPAWAADRTQAMAAARFHRPQAILLDLGLPGVDGLVVLERLKNTRLMSDIPVIVVTFVIDKKRKRWHGVWARPPMCQNPSTLTR